MPIFLDGSFCKASHGWFNLTLQISGFHWPSNLSDSPSPSPYLSSYTVYISHDTCHNVKFLLTWLLLGSCHWFGSSVKAIILLIVFIAVILRVVPSILLLNDELIGWLNEWKTERTDLFLRRSNVDALAHRKICIQIWAPSHTS